MDEGVIKWGLPYNFFNMKINNYIHESKYINLFIRKNYKLFWDKNKNKSNINKRRIKFLIINYL